MGGITKPRCATSPLPFLLSSSESICFCLLLFNLFSAFSAQKSHVKSLNPLTAYKSITSAWHFSYAQTAILDIEIKTRKPRWEYPPGLTRLERIFLAQPFYYEYFADSRV